MNDQTKVKLLNFKFRLQTSGGISSSVEVDFDSRFYKKPIIDYVISPRSISASVYNYKLNIPKHFIKRTLSSFKIRDLDFKFVKPQSVYLRPPKDDVDYKFEPDIPPEDVVIYQSGWHSLNFGSGSIVWNYNTIANPIGFQSSVVSPKAIVFNKTTVVSVNSIDIPSNQVSKATNIWNTARELKMSGFKSDLHGTQYIFNRIGKINTTGWLSQDMRATNWRTPTHVWHRWRLVNPVGDDHSQIPLHYVREHFDDNRQYIKPQGYVYSIIGRHVVWTLRRSLYVNGIDNKIITGEPDVDNWLHIVEPDGIVHTAWGKPTLQNKKRVLYALSFVATGWSNNRLEHRLRVAKPYGIREDGYGNLTRVWNFNPWVQLDRLGFIASEYGIAKVRNLRHSILPASMKAPDWRAENDYTSPSYTKPHIYLKRREVTQVPNRGPLPPELQYGMGRPSMTGGKNSIYPSAIVPWYIDYYTKEKVEFFGNHEIALGHMVRVPSVGPWVDDILSPDGGYYTANARVGWHWVKPNIIYPSSLNVQTRYGTPAVAPHPFPKGWESAHYGQPWVSGAPREVKPVGTNMQQFGIVNIRDRARYVTQTSELDSIAIFGITRAYNKNQIMDAFGWDSFLTTRWHTIASNVKWIKPPSIYKPKFGLAAFQTTPELWQGGWRSDEYGNAWIGNWVRKIIYVGIEKPETRYGNADVRQEPVLFPKGWSNAMVSINATVEYLNRKLDVASIRSRAVVGIPTIMFKNRKILHAGRDFVIWGNANITNAEREITMRDKGINQSQVSSGGWVSFRVRNVYPESFQLILPSLHMVGTHRTVMAHGWLDEQFGKRIIPDNVSVYTKGFTGVVPMPFVELKHRKVAPWSWQSGNSDPERIGRGIVWNRVQFAHVKTDNRDGLYPPDMHIFHKVFNRNMNMQTYGTFFGKVGKHLIYLNARIVSPIGIDSAEFGKHLIADGVRYLQPESWESTVTGRWSSVWNSAYEFKVSGIDESVFGLAAVKNTRRYFYYIGLGEQTLFGKPVVTHSTRTLSFEERNTIAPPIIRLPNVHNYLSFVDNVSCGYFFNMGMPALSSRRNQVFMQGYINTRYGDVGLRNVTPEIHTRGINSVEWGIPKTFNLVQYIKPKSVDMTDGIGHIGITYRNRKMQVAGFHSLKVGTSHKVTKTGTPAYYPQYISLTGKVYVDEGTGEVTYGDGYGIKGDMYGMPIFNQFVIMPSSITSGIRVGEATIWSNVLQVDNGIGSQGYGRPTIKVMRIYSGQVYGIAPRTTVGMPRISPHTIYAPQGGGGGHPILVGTNRYSLGIDIGHHYVWRFENPKAYPYGFSDFRYGYPVVFNTKRYVKVTGFANFRMGVHRLGDALSKANPRSLGDTMLFGRPDIHIPKPTVFTQYVYPYGFIAGTFSQNRIDLFNRNIYPYGMHTLNMGYSRGGSIYMPQSLYVGKPPKPPMQGFICTLWGKHYIDFKNRMLEPLGWDSFTMEYTDEYFDGRLKVIRRETKPPVPESKVITAMGFVATGNAVPDIKHGTYFIRPDGNSDQYRKGAQHAKD